MIVIFDMLCAQPIGTMKFHGGGEYTKAVFQYVANKANELSHCKVEICYDFNKFIDKWILDLCDRNGIVKHDVKNIADISRIINSKEKGDSIRFFAGMGYNYNSANVNFSPNVVSIGTFHGLRVLEKSYDAEAWRYGTYKRRIHEFLDWVILREHCLKKERTHEASAMSNFDFIITVSKHSEYSIKINFPEIANKAMIQTLYSPQKYISNISEDNAVSDRYIMMVSADRWLKNSYRGMVALDGLYEKGYLSGIKTKVFGNAPAGIRKKLKNVHMFEFYDYVSSNELEKAYAGCEIFFYPSLNEGFGYPPLEAMKYGKTCVISAICSLPEVYQDSVYYFNPYDIMEMQNRLLQAVNEKISNAKIKDCIDRITNKQKNDLEKLANLILGTEE